MYAKEVSLSQNIVVCGLRKLSHRWAIQQYHNLGQQKMKITHLFLADS